MRCGIAVFGIRDHLTRFFDSILGFSKVASPLWTACMAFEGIQVMSKEMPKERMDKVLEVRKIDSIFWRTICLLFAQSIVPAPSTHAKRPHVCLMTPNCKLPA